MDEEKKAEHLQAEIERLREVGIMGRDTAYRRRDAAEAEVKQLQAKLDGLVERVEKRIEKYLATEKDFLYGLGFQHAMVALRAELGEEA